MQAITSLTSSQAGRKEVGPIDAFIEIGEQVAGHKDDVEDRPHLQLADHGQHAAAKRQQAAQRTAFDKLYQEDRPQARVGDDLEGPVPGDWDGLSTWSANCGVLEAWATAARVPGDSSSLVDLSSTLFTLQGHLGRGDGCKMSCSVWAVDTNAASNWLHGR